MVDDVVLALLHVQPAQGDERIVRITHTPFQVGRAQPSDLQLPGQRVSRQHIRLLFEDDHVSLVDLNSSNGTLLAGTRLPPNQPQPIEFGQRFTIGDYTLWLEAVAAPRDVTVPVRAPEPEILPEPESGLPVAMPEPEADQAVAILEPEAVPEAAELIAPPPVESAPAAPAPQLIGSAPTPLAPPPLPPATKATEDLPPSDEGGWGVPSDGSRYLRYLPPIYREDPFLGHFLQAFEEILVPIEQTVDNFDLYLDPYATPAFFLGQLAAWLDLTLDEKWPLDKRRQLVAEAAELYRRRGTHWSLSRFLEIYTGVVPQIVESEDQPHLFSVVLRLPAGSRNVDRATVERIIEVSKPAHTVYTLEIFKER
jgi:phage tail-like protein